MRRPLKPFVTEYRGGSRRSASQGPAPGLDLFKSEPTPSTPSPWTPPQPDAPQEDGYEAALRAADALFSGAAKQAVAATPPSPPLASVPPSEAAADLAPKSLAPTTGRILRVLDEPPTPEMLELQRLEAERAPKRRGRKPGSKNKPKVAALDATPVAAPAAVPLPVEVPPLPVATVTAALAARAIAAAPRRVEPLAAAAPGERYAWVRTRLKPGQQWKRRLPKVAW